MSSVLFLYGFGFPFLNFIVFLEDILKFNQVMGFKDIDVKIYIFDGQD
jgi:hypothetical protein